MKEAKSEKHLGVLFLVWIESALGFNWVALIIRCIMEEVLACSFQNVEVHAVDSSTLAAWSASSLT